MSVWGIFLVACVLAFSVLEISGVYFGAPWGACTTFIRTSMTTYPLLHWVVAGLVAFAYLHLFGDWP